MDRRLGWVIAAVLTLGVVGAGVGSAWWLSQPAESQRVAADLDVAAAAGRSAGGPSPSNDDAQPTELEPMRGTPTGAPAPPPGSAESVGEYTGETGGDAVDIIESAVKSMDIDGVTAVSLGRRCEAGPCVLGIRIGGTPEQLEQARQALFQASDRIDYTKGQPTFDWSEGEGGATGFMWMVPNEMSAESSAAFEAGVAINKKALITGG